jgi:hypothetical protein
MFELIDDGKEDTANAFGDAEKTVGGHPTHFLIILPLVAIQKMVNNRGNVEYNINISLQEFISFIDTALVTAIPMAANKENQLSGPGAILTMATAMLSVFLTGMLFFRKNWEEIIKEIPEDFPEELKAVVLRQIADAAANNRKSCVIIIDTGETDEEASKEIKTPLH